MGEVGDVAVYLLAGLGDEAEPSCRVALTLQLLTLAVSHLLALALAMLGYAALLAKDSRSASISVRLSRLARPRILFFSNQLFPYSFSYRKHCRILLIIFLQ